MLTPVKAFEERSDRYQRFVDRWVEGALGAAWFVFAGLFVLALVAMVAMGLYSLLTG